MSRKDRGFKGQSYPCKGEGGWGAHSGLAAGMGNSEAIKNLVSSPFNESYGGRNAVSIKSSCHPAV